MTDDRLNYLGDMYIGFEMSTLLKIEFSTFLTQPEAYINKAINLRDGDGLLIQDDMTTSVEIA